MKININSFFVDFMILSKKLDIILDINAFNL